MTGTLECAASSSSAASEPVRSPITAAWRESTRAASPIDSPRVSCISSERRIIGWPPSSNTPASNEVRVRVEGFSKISATVRPSSGRALSGSALSSAARSSSAWSSSPSSSSPVMKCLMPRPA